MPIKVAINGFGRIGRQAFKIALEKKNIQVVAINDLGPLDFYAYLLKYDTAHGPYNKEVIAKKDHLLVDGKKYPKFSIPEVSLLPWKQLKVDVVLECTGIFTEENKAKQHLAAGAKNVIISAPGKGDGIQTIVLGVNDKALSKKFGKIISNASCTTNCIAPVMEIMNEKFGIVKSLMTTVHAYTASQSVVDGGKAKDFRESRAAAMNMIPTSTGAAKASALVIPELKNKFDGLSIRVPIITGSISDITMVLKKKTTVEEINDHFKQMAKTVRFKGIIMACEDPIVSSDIVGTAYSSIIDLPLTRVIGGDLAKVVAWYDNEWGYSNRLVELAEKVGRK